MGEGVCAHARQRPHAKFYAPFPSHTGRFGRHYLLIGSSLLLHICTGIGLLQLLTAALSEGSQQYLYKKQATHVWNTLSDSTTTYSIPTSTKETQPHKERLNKLSNLPLQAPSERIVGNLPQVANLDLNIPHISRSVW